MSTLSFGVLAAVWLENFSTYHLAEILFLLPSLVLELYR